MYEFAGSKSAKLVVSEYGKLVARILQYIACLTRVQIYNKSSHVALCFAVFHSILVCFWTLMFTCTPEIFWKIFNWWTLFFTFSHSYFSVSIKDKFDFIEHTPKRHDISRKIPGLTVGTANNDGQKHIYFLSMKLYAAARMPNWQTKLSTLVNHLAYIKHLWMPPSLFDSTFSISGPYPPLGLNRKQG